MYTGRQYMQYFPGNSQGLSMAGKLWTPPSPSWSARSITNRVRPIIRTEIARLISNKPNASVVPASSEDQDLFAAQAGEQVWEALYHGNKVHQKFSTAMFWMTICGTAFMKTWWDQNGYDCVTKETGTITYAPVTPFHVFVPDLYEVDIESQPWLFNVYTKPVSWVQAIQRQEGAPDQRVHLDPGPQRCPRYPWPAGPHQIPASADHRHRGVAPGEVGSLLQAALGGHGRRNRGG